MLASSSRRTFATISEKVFFFFFIFVFFKKVLFSSWQVIQREKSFAAQTYHPLPVVWTKAKGCDVWDVDGNQYLDFLASYSAVNQGHCHPRLINAMVSQARCKRKERKRVIKYTQHNILLGSKAGLVVSGILFGQVWRVCRICHQILWL